LPRRTSLRERIQSSKGEGVWKDRFIFNLCGKVCMHVVPLSTYLMCHRLDPSESDFGVQCMHGPEECAGNVQQLCVAKYEPSSNWWEFVQCQNYEGRDKIGSPDVTLKCARAAGIDWSTSQAGECAGLDGSGKGSEGAKLLRESVILSQILGIKWSHLYGTTPS
jgi:Gamma interferon inducible lysosomal thiol reductase (GILT)